jgi:hypothetical protein
MLGRVGVLGVTLVANILHKSRRNRLAAGPVPERLATFILGDPGQPRANG